MMVMFMIWSIDVFARIISELDLAVRWHLAWSIFHVIQMITSFVFATLSVIESLYTS